MYNNILKESVRIIDIQYKKVFVRLKGNEKYGTSTGKQRRHI